MNFILCISKHYTEKGSVADVGVALQRIPRTFLHTPAGFQLPIFGSENFPSHQRGKAALPSAHMWQVGSARALTPLEQVCDASVPSPFRWEDACALLAPEEPAGVSSSCPFYWLPFLPHCLMGISYTSQISNLHSGSVSDRTPTKIGSQAKKKAKKKKKKIKKPCKV